MLSHYSACPEEQQPYYQYRSDTTHFDNSFSNVRPSAGEGRLSFCSIDSCSSHFSDSSGDEPEEDTLDRWPWIQEVRADGTLFYLESYVLRHNEDYSTRGVNESEINGPASRRLRLGRLKQALKRNRSLKKERRKHDSSDKDNPSTNNNLLNGSRSVNGELSKLKISRATSNPLVDVTVEIAKEHLSIDSSGSLLEDVLGIIAGLDLDPVAGERNNSSLLGNTGNDDTDTIVIQGLLAERPAANQSEIAIGDILVAVAGVEVTIHNVSKVLSAIIEPCEVSLTIEKRPVVICPGQGQSKLFDLVAGSIEDNTALVAHQEACAVMYLTLESRQEDDPDDDVLYWYPKTLGYNKLRKIRGMFLTIGDLMDSVTSSSAKSSHLIMDCEALNIGYLVINDNILAIALPDSKVKPFQMEQQVSELERLLAFMFGSLEDAFLEVNRLTLNHLVALCLERLLLGLPVKTQGTPSNLTACCLGGVRCLHLPAQNQVHISSILSDAEAADYGECIDDFFPHRRLYSTLGTCLFYKGHLICNHLPDDDLRDCLTYCKEHCLFALTEQHRVNQMVIWKEVFPTRRSDFGRFVTQKDCLRLEEPDGRYFLLIVGLKHSVLCALLEAGGIASMPEGSPGPHPYHVDTALSIIAYVQETLDFETICEARLRGPAIPSLYSPSDANGARSASAAVIGYEIAVSKKPGPRTDAKLSIDSNRSPARGEDSPMTNGSYSLSRSRKDSQDSENSRSSSSVGSAGQRRSVPTSSSSDLVTSPRATLNRKSTAVGVVGDFASLIATKLTDGPCNSLFYYASLDLAKGVVICPTTPISNDVVHQDILRNFVKVCGIIRKQFLCHGNQNQSTQERQVTRGLPRLQEFGAQFTTTSSATISKSPEGKKWRQQTRYWVIGRKARSREFYVCYEQGTPQNTIELAFKLGFGVTS